MLTGITIAFLLVTPAETESEATPDAIAILSAQPISDLHDVNQAAEQLRVAPTPTNRPLQTRRGKPGETLGIGALGGDFADPLRYPSIYARRTDEPARRARIEQRLAALSERVSQCYGDPLKDGTLATDSLALRVVVLPDGKLAGHVIVKAPQLGSPRLDDCLGKLLARTTFAAGKNPLAVDYTWTFRLGGNSSYRFDG